MIGKPDSPPTSPAPKAPPNSAASSAEAGLGDSSVPSGSSGSLGGRSSSHSDEPTRVSDSRVSRGEVVPEVIERPAIEGYEIHSEIHRGGQGVVYRATQIGTKRLVALKVLLEGELASETTRRRFEREVELAASLRHPNIVTILDSGVSRGRMFFAMEFVDGLRLDHFLQQRPVELRDVIELLAEICSAVNFAHQRGVIHRDLKPSNILVSEEGAVRSDASHASGSNATSFGGPRAAPKVLDFGLAKVERSADPRETTVRALSVTGQVVGTLAYMSPEQAAGADTVDVRSDVYSLGVICYEAMLGTTPYPISGPLGEILNRIANDDPIRPRSIRVGSRFGRQIDDELETILLKALEKDPARRYQTAGELGEDFRHYLAGEPIEAKRASGLYMLKKTLRRYRLQAIAAGAVLMSLIISLFLMAGWYRSERDARTQAEELRTLAKLEAENARTAAAAAAEARARESEAREAAEADKRRAQRAADTLRNALVRQKIQRADLAELRGDLAEARDSYWDAYCDAPDNPGALWELRQYYSQSGDAGARQLHYRTYGPTALSPSGELVAVCEAPRAITIRNTLTGRTIAHYPAPGDVRLVYLDNGGRVAACGDDWLRVWHDAVECVDPMLLAGELSEARAVRLTYDAQVVVLFERRAVRSFDAERGELLATAELQGELSAPPVVSPIAEQIAAATSAGVELVRVLEDGRLSVDWVWGRNAPRAARDARFAASGALAVLSDGVDLITFDAAGSGRVSRLFSLREEWERLDVARDGATVALADRNGRIAMYTDGRPGESWQISESAARELRLSTDGATLATLDSRGSLTQWTHETRRERRRMVHNRRAAHWVASDDGSTLVMVDSEGRVIAFAPHRSAAAIPVVLPSLMGMLTSRTADDILIACNDTGEQIAVGYDNRVWIKELGRPRTVNVRWNNSLAPSLRRIALSGDGRLLALFSQSERGDRQVLTFQQLDSVAADRPRGVVPPPQPPLMIELPGSAVTWMQYVPASNRVLIARANAELLLIDPADYATSKPDLARGIQPFAEEPWALLDSPAYRVAVDRDGRLMAVASDDGVIRVLSVLDTIELAHLSIGREVRSMSFDSAGELLLVRTVDGATNLFHVDEQESVAYWPASSSVATPLAAWIGREDAIVTSDGDGVFETQYRGADAVIRAGDSYARQRQVVRRIADGDLAGAWLEAGKLREIDGPLGREAQLVIVEATLRRARVEPPFGRLEAVLDGADIPTLIRVAHAAYDGARFEIARACFERAAAESATLDVQSEHRRAECEYLLGDAGKAADLLGAVLKRGRLAPGEFSQTVIERIAALALAGRSAEATTVLGELESQATRGARREPGLISAVMMGKLMLDRHAATDQRMNPVTRMVLSNLIEQFPDTRDDVEFYAGELARVRGDLPLARSHYERCVDVARDDWPVHWARFRLRSLDAATP